MQNIKLITTKHPFLLLILVLIVLFSTEIYSEESGLTGALGLNYQSAPDDDQQILQLDFSLDINENNSAYISYANLKSEDEVLLPQLQLNDVDARVTELGIEHWLANQNFGFGISYANWDGSNNLKNNDLTANLNYQTNNWLFGLEFTRRDLELAVTVLLPNSGLTTIQRENDGLGIGFNTVYGGWENFLVSFEHKQYNYDGDIVDFPRFEQLQNFIFASNNPLEETTTGINLAYYTDTGHFLSCGISVETSLFLEDSTQYNITYEMPLSSSINATLGYLLVEQDSENSNVFSLGFSWNF